MFFLHRHFYLMWMFIFLLLPLLGITYIGWHIWCILPLAWGWKLLVILLMVIVFIMMLGLRGGLDHMPLHIASTIYETSTSSLFVMLYLVIIFLILDLGRLFHLIPRTLLYHNGMMACSLTVMLFVIFLCGNLHYKNKYRQTITLTTDKQLSKPIRILMMSDLHLGYHNRRNELHRWVNMINEERPDLVLIAGDIIDMSMRPLREEHMEEEFKRIKVPVYACLGNHEYYSGEPDAQRFYRDAGICLLRDSLAFVDDLCLIGRDDRTNPHRQTLKTIMTQADMDKFCILLDHQPYHLEQAESQHLDFQFSGHTHYGQVWPISWITNAIYECAFGEHQRGNTKYYISSGIGIWGGKFRIGTRSEYVVVEIKKK